MEEDEFALVVDRGRDQWIRASATRQPRPGWSGQGDVIPITNPFKDEGTGASAAAVGDQVRAAGANWSPALARLEFDLLIGIP